MCGRYTLTSVGQIPLRFGVAEAALEPRYNVAPSQLAPVLIAGRDGPELRSFRWGFTYPGGDSTRPAPINARAETLIERPMFRGALARRRCLVPADGFYEWQVQPGKRAKQPYLIGLRDGDLFACAGLYTAGHDGDGTFAIITTVPNPLVAEIHHRMPVILRRDHEDFWLDAAQDDPLVALQLLETFPAEQMTAFPVSSLVSNVRNDGPELLLPIQLAGMRRLGDSDESL